MNVERRVIDLTGAVESNGVLFTMNQDPVVTSCTAVRCAVRTVVADAC